MLDIAIIGGGISGAILSAELSELGQVSIFEKARGVGGRMSTRYTDKYSFDHGAPIISLDTASLANDHIQMLLEQDVLKKWECTVANMDILHPHNKLHYTQQSFYLSHTKMNLVVKSLMSKSANIYTQTRVTSVHKNDNRLSVYADTDKLLGEFDIVILAIPAPQAKSLLFDSCIDITDITASMEIIFSCMLGSSKHMPEYSWEIAKIDNSKLNKVVLNHKKPLRSKYFSAVAYATSKWSTAHSNDDKQTIQNHLVQECANILDIDTNIFDYISCHRWLYAITDKVQTNTQGFIYKDSLGICGDWLLGCDVSSAIQSATNLSNYIKSTI
jgi:renalase